MDAPGSDILFARKILPLAGKANLFGQRFHMCATPFQQNWPDMCSHFGCSLINALQGEGGPTSAFSTTRFDMIGNSTAEYIWVVTWAGILHSIGPISVIYCLLATFLHRYLQPARYLQYWAFVETIFYFLTYIYQRHHLQRPALHPPPISEEERNKLFDLCLNSTQDYEQYISKWFLDEPLSAIKRENVKEFYRWAFLNTDVADPSHEDELEMYVEKLEERIGVQFEQGIGEVKSVRLTLDKVNALHRSLIWYMVSKPSSNREWKLIED